MSNNEDDLRPFDFGFCNLIIKLDYNIRITSSLNMLIKNIRNTNDQLATELLKSRS